MTDHQKETQANPLLFKIEPGKSEQVFSRQLQEEQQETDEEQSNKEEKIEQIKREFGVYEVMEEIEREKAIANEWVQAYRTPEQVEQQPIVHEQQESPEKKAIVKKKKKRKSVKEILTKLAASTKEPKPVCEATIFGKKTQFQVLGIREEIVKIRIGHRIRIIKLSDIKQFKVISR